MMRKKAIGRGVMLSLISLLAGGDAHAAAQGSAPVNGALAVAHHQHLMSPTWRKMRLPVALKPVAVPDEIGRVLRERERISGNDLATDLYTEDVLLVGVGTSTDPWQRGWTTARNLASRYEPSPVLIPLTYSMEGSVGYVAGTLRPSPAGEDEMNFVFGLAKGSDGKWRIAVEDMMTKSPNDYPGPIVASDLIRQMDDAGVRHAVLLGLGYVYGSPLFPQREGEYELVRAENDWTAEQAEPYRDRLMVFCGVNPLKDYAIQEARRCASDRRFGGLKLHFANSGIDLKKAHHTDKLRSFFAEANRLRMPIVAHVWTLDPKYGAEESRILLREVLPMAPRIVVQIAHMAGAGTYRHDDALAIFAEAVARNDPATANLYFDLTSIVNDSTPDVRLNQLASRIRQIGVERVLFGSDMHPNPELKTAWATLRRRIPLTPAEIKAIADNVAPYMTRAR